MRLKNSDKLLLEHLMHKYNASEIKNAINETRVTTHLNYSDNEEDIVSNFTAGIDYSMTPGVIIGAPIYSEAAAKTVERFIERHGFELGNTYADWMYEEDDIDPDTPWVYFVANGSNTADCYVFGSGGVHIIK